MSKYIDAEWLIKESMPLSFSVQKWVNEVQIMTAPSIDICFCEECMYADENPIADGRYWCALHQCFMRFCSDGKEERSRR